MQTKLIAFLAIFLSVAIVAFAADDEKQVPLSEVPAAAQKTITSRIGEGKLTGIAQTNEGGETNFDVRFAGKTGDEQGFSVADDGTLLSVEIALGATPTAVQQTIRAQASGWELEGIDKNVDDPDISYDVTVSKASRQKCFTVAADGELLSMGIELTEAPVAVQLAIKTQVADGSVNSIDENFDPDGNSFDVVTVTKAGGRQSFSIAPDGKMLSQEVTLQECAPRVRRTIQEKMGDGKVLRIDKSLSEKKDGVLPYEVQGRKDGRPFDFSVGPHGKFLGMGD